MYIIVNDIFIDHLYELFIYLLTYIPTNINDQTCKINEEN